MSGDTHQPRLITSPLAAVGLALGYVALGLLGRATVPDDSPFALIWPATGFGVLWFLLRGARMASLDTVLLVIATLVVNQVGGAPLDLVSVFSLSSVVQILVAVVLLRRWCAELWGCGGDGALASPRLLISYLGALSGAIAVGAVLGALGAWAAMGKLTGVGALLWFGRNLGSALILTTLGLLVGEYLSRPRPRPAVLGAHRVPELAAAVAFTGVTYSLVFGLENLPVAFPLLGATVWFGLRFPTLVSATHSFVVSTVTLWLTFLDVGPFASADRQEVGFMLAQFYVVTLIVTGLGLSTGRDERAALAAELR